MRGLLNFLLVGLLFFSTIGFVFKRVGDAQFIVSQARETNLYGRLTHQIEASLPEEFTENSGLSGEELSAIVRDSIDSETFYTSLEGYLDSQIKWLSSQTENNSFTFDLEPIKQTALNKITQKQLTEYSQLPTCNASQARTWNLDEGMPQCRLSAVSTSEREIELALRASNEEGLSSLPSTLATPPPSDKLLASRSTVTRAHQAVLVVWLLTAGLIALFWLIYRHRALLPLAVTFILVGLLQVGFSLIAWDWIGRIIAESFNGQGSSAAFMPLIIDVATTILTALKKSLGNISIITLSIGAFFLVLGIVSMFHRPKVTDRDSAQR